jgi:hypothetical protein
MDMDDKPDKLLQLPTISSRALIESRARAREILANPTTPAATALRAAKQLVGQWPHARPDDPETWLAALGAALAAYPPAVVQECVDPRRGLAQHREFPPTVAAIVEWCDSRLSRYRTEAAAQTEEELARFKLDFWERTKTWPFAGPDPDSAGCEISKGTGQVG